MKLRKLLNGVLACTMALSMVSVSNAVVFYNEETDMYFSTSESDGTLAFNGTVFNEDGSIYGTNPEDGRYLENIVPTDENELNTIQPHNVLERSGVASTYSYFYTPEENYVIFMLSNDIRTSDTEMLIEIIDSSTGNVVARGSKLEVNRPYKVTAEVKDTPLQINIGLNSTLRFVPDLSVSCSDSKIAEITVDDLSNSKFSVAEYENTDNPTQFAVTPPIRYTIDQKVPVNLNGNQGKKLLTLLAPTRLNQITTYYVGSSSTFGGSLTNYMTTINLAYRSYLENVSSTMYLRVGKTFQFEHFLVAGETLDFYMSTNSTSAFPVIDVTTVSN